MLSIVKAQHGQVRSSTGTAKFGQALVLRSVVVHGTGNARRGVVYQCTALAKYGVVLFGDVLVQLSMLQCWYRTVLSSQGLVGQSWSRLGLAQPREAWAPRCTDRWQWYKPPSM